MKTTIGLLLTLILLSCQTNITHDTQIFEAHALSIVQPVSFSDYISSISISKLPQGYEEILNQNEIKMNDDSTSYDWTSTIEDKRFQFNYTGAQTYDICVCESDAIIDNGLQEEDISKDKYTIFKRLKPINDSIEAVLLLGDKDGQLDLVTICINDGEIIDSLNLNDAYDGDFMIFKLFYISEDYKITLKSFWFYEDSGHTSPFERSKCEYKINATGKIVSYFNQNDGMVDVKLETVEAGKSIYHTLFSGEIKNHLKNGTWIEKKIINSFLNVATGNYVDGVKDGMWITNQYYNKSINIDLHESLSDYSDTIVYK
ncbi:hypothetical protein [uncultured Cytophaga sp.]|uniref:hypothetical protein n=1 Tax=uncultured Cytophaga sp. TaxID=160238 RepID=UPI00260F9418|nr:hypothetical protein [uncultured Cytophaga sp.]